MIDFGPKFDYKAVLRKEIVGRVSPCILDVFDAESCIAHEDDKEIYVMRRKSDGVLGLLRISKGDALQDPIAEARLLQKLNHRAIPKAFFAHVENGKRYLVREYFEGQTLNVLVRSRGVLPAKEIISIAMQMCDVLQYLHQQEPPVIHRDIKPENIVMTPDGEIKLIDFGIARKFQADAKNDTIAIGSRPYMAPEQFGGAQTDGRSDIYSLGMVMLFLAIGAPVRSDLTGVQHKGLREVIGKCIEFSPGARFQSAMLLKKHIRMAKHWQLAKIRRNFPKLAGITVSVLAVVTLIVLLWNNTRTLRSPNVELKEDLIAQAVRQWNHLEAQEPIKQIDVQLFQSVIKIIGNVPFPNNESIHIVDCRYEYFAGGVLIKTRGDIESLEDIKGMTNLRDLALIHQRITDLGAIGNLRLSTLDIDDNEVRDISPLAQMDSLTKLFLSENPIENIGPLAGLKNLEELDISTTMVSDISPLAGLTKLAVLEMRGVTVADLSVFDQLPALNDVSMTSVIADDFDPVRRHKGWRGVDVSYTNMENPLDIENTDQIIFLNVGGTSLASLHGIERFDKLTELWIHDSGIDSLDGIENLHNLEKLHLHYTKVSDISPIVGLENLREVDVGYTNITDLTPLLGRAKPLTIICGGLSEEVLAPMRGQPNITLDD